MRRPCLAFFTQGFVPTGAPTPDLVVLWWDQVNKYRNFRRGVDLSTWNWIDLILSFNGVPAQERDAFLPETAETEELAQRPALR